MILPSKCHLQTIKQAAILMTHPFVLGVRVSVTYITSVRKPKTATEVNVPRDFFLLYYEGINELGFSTRIMSRGERKRVYANGTI